MSSRRTSLTTPVFPRSITNPSHQNRDPIQIHSTVNGKIICTENLCSISRHPIAKKLYETVEKIHAFFLVNFKLNGIDGNGEIRPLHIEWEEDNAQWTCETERCIWQFHDPYAMIPAVVAHEYVHGIIHRHKALGCCAEAGALDESIADILGAVFERHVFQKTDWQVHDRDMQEHTDMDAFLDFADPTEENDYGYVHHNSLIPSHAFVCVVDSLNEANEVSSHDIEKMVARLWFKSTLKLSTDATFADLAQKTIQKAQKYDRKIRERGIVTDFRLATIVQNAWRHVKVLS